MLYRACDCYHHPCIHNPGVKPKTKEKQMKVIGYIAIGATITLIIVGLFAFDLLKVFWNSF